MTELKNDLMSWMNWVSSRRQKISKLLDELVKLDELDAELDESNEQEDALAELGEELVKMDKQNEMQYELVK